MEPSIPLGRKFWALDGEERDALDRLFAEPGVWDLVLSLNGRGGDAGVRLVDAAYWMKGCFSLGNLRYAGLVRITETGGKRKLALVDLKEAAKAFAPSFPDADMPPSASWPAHGPYRRTWASAC